MWESSALLGALTPKFYVALTGTSSLISGLILIFEWWYFRKYGTSFIEQVSLTHLGPWLGAGPAPSPAAAAGASAGPDPDGGGGGGGGGSGAGSGECRVWRNPMSLLRGAEYARLWAARRQAPLTYYDMNLTAQDHQAWFGGSECGAADGATDGATDGASAADGAAECLSRAWRERDPALRVSLARRALDLSPDCAPALLLLAEEDAPTVLEAERVLKRALIAAESSWRGAVAGCGAGSAAARRAGGVVAHVKRRLAMCARRLGRVRDAARGFRELSREPHPALQALLPHENLLEVLLEQRAYADVQAVVARYEEGGPGVRTATLLYTAALVRARHGPDAAAADAMRRAVQYNPYVGEYLLESRALSLPPEHIVRRGESEALAYAFAHLSHWRRAEPALRLLHQHHQSVERGVCGGAARGGDGAAWAEGGGGGGGCAACADRELVGGAGGGGVGAAGGGAGGGGRRAPALLPLGAVLCAGCAALALLAHRWPDALHPHNIHTLLAAL